MMETLNERMSLAQTPAELTNILRVYFETEQIKSLAVTYYNQHTKTAVKLLYEWASPALQTWHKYYIEQGYADVDRTLESLEHSLIPVFWDSQLQLLQAKNTRERRMREESIAFGIDKGICISVFGPKKDLLVLVLHQRRLESGLMHWQKKQFLWQGITQIYFYYLRKLLVDSSQLIPLTRREEECLRLTAEGLRTEMIAQYLKISVRTVHFHLQNANKKLGVSNKYLAMQYLK